MRTQFYFVLVSFKGKEIQHRRVEIETTYFLDHLKAYPRAKQLSFHDYINSDGANLINLILCL